MLTTLNTGALIRGPGIAIDNEEGKKMVKELVNLEITRRVMYRGEPQDIGTELYEVPIAEAQLLCGLGSAEEIDDEPAGFEELKKEVKNAKSAVTRAENKGDEEALEKATQRLADAEEALAEAEAE